MEKNLTVIKKHLRLSAERDMIVPEIRLGRLCAEARIGPIKDFDQAKLNKAVSYLGGSLCIRGDNYFWQLPVLDGVELMNVQLPNTIMYTPSLNLTFSNWTVTKAVWDQKEARMGFDPLKTVLKQHLFLVIWVRHYFHVIRTWNSKEVTIV
jgi:hypothetical protein